MTATYCSETLITSTVVVELTASNFITLSWTSLSCPSLTVLIYLRTLAANYYDFSASLVWRHLFYPLLHSVIYRSVLPVVLNPITSTLHVNILWDRGSETWEVSSLDAFPPTSDAKKLFVNITLSNLVRTYQHFRATYFFSCMLGK